VFPIGVVAGHLNGLELVDTCDPVQLLQDYPVEVNAHVLDLAGLDPELAQVLGVEPETFFESQLFKALHL